MSDMRIATNTSTPAAKSSDAASSNDARSQDAFSSMMADATQRNANNAAPAASDAPSNVEPAPKNAKARSADDKDGKDESDSKDAKSDADTDSASASTVNPSAINATAALLVQSLPAPAAEIRDAATVAAPLLTTGKELRFSSATVRSAEISDLGASAGVADRFATSSAKAQPAAASAPDDLLSAAASRPASETKFDVDLRAALEHAAQIGDKLSASVSSSAHSELPQLSAAMAAISSASAPASITPPAQFSVATPVLSPAFADDFSQRVMFLANQRIHSAEISVSPADLGPVTVKIEMRGNEASLSFNAANATTRTALQDALPRLHAMFESSGLQLANASVGGDTRRDAPDARRNGGGPNGVAAIGAAGATDGLASAALPAVSVSTRSVRLVDTFV